MEQFLKFKSVEEDPNLEIISFENQRYLARQLDPDTARERWIYHSDNLSLVVYDGGIIPKKMINQMIRLTLEGFEFPEPTIEELKQRFELDI